jgi:hypothetical protein
MTEQKLSEVELRRWLIEELEKRRSILRLPFLDNVAVAHMLGATDIIELILQRLDKAVADYSRCDNPPTEGGENA